MSEFTQVQMSYDVQTNPVFAPFKGLSNHPLIPVGQDFATLYGVLAQVLVAPLKEGIDPAFGVNSELREIIGRDTVFAVIGEITGLDDNNNPATTMKYNVPQDFIPGTMYEAQQKWAKDKDFYGRYVNGQILTNTKNYPIRMYGEHNSEERESEFWNVFTKRLYWGDTVPHAALVAREHLKIWRSAGKMLEQFRYCKIGPNQASQGERVINETSPNSAFMSKDLILFTKRFYETLGNYCTEYLKTGYPSAWAAIEGRVNQKMTAPPKPFTLKSGATGGKSTTLIGAGLAAAGALVLLRGRK